MKVKFYDRSDRVRFMMKFKQDNDVTDCICVVYIEIEIELSWSIG